MENCEGDMQSMHQSRWLTASMMEKMAQKCSFSLHTKNNILWQEEGICKYV